MTTCEKCKGSGFLPHHSNYHGGQCFGCGGTGEAKAKRKSETKRAPVKVVRVAKPIPLDEPWPFEF